MEIRTGTIYRLGELGDVELVEAASAKVKVVSSGISILDETLYGDADGWVRISGFGDLLKPYMVEGASSGVSISVDNSTISFTVSWNMLSDSGDATATDSREANGPLVRTFYATLADGRNVSIPVYGVEVEVPEVERTELTMNGVTRIVEARYQVSHKLMTGRLSGAGIRLMTGLAAARTVDLPTGERVIIDAEGDIARTVNDPLADRMATISWRYAKVDYAHREYAGVPALAEARQELPDEDRKVLYTFVYDWNGVERSLKIYGTDAEKRELEGDEVFSSEEGLRLYDEKCLSIAHTVNTGRMSRVELRALVCMMASTSVKLGGKAVIVDISDVEISSDPESERTASFTWRYADRRARKSIYE